jgi:uncharacterized membrane protein
MSDLDQALAATEKNVEQGQKAIEEYTQRRQQDDRSLIAKLIVYAFVGMIFFVVAVLCVALFYFRSWSAIEEPAKFLVAILSSVLLPVVTLVIGYYFGKDK